MDRALAREIGAVAEAKASLRALGERRAAPTAAGRPLVAAAAALASGVALGRALYAPGRSRVAKVYVEALAARLGEAAAPLLLEQIRRRR